MWDRKLMNIDESVDFRDDVQLFFDFCQIGMLEFT